MYVETQGWSGVYMLCSTLHAHYPMSEVSQGCDSAPPYGHTLVAVNLTLSVVNDSTGFQAMWQVCGSRGARGAWFPGVLVVKVVNEFGGVRQDGSSYLGLLFGRSFITCPLYKVY